MIDGVVITPLKQFSDERGKVMHMLRNDAPHFLSFGEIYFSTVNPGAVKGWHLQEKMTLNYAVPHGEVKLVLYDNRNGSKTCGKIQEILLGPASYYLVTVPALIWSGFMGWSNNPAIVANCASVPHNPDEAHRKDLQDSSIPYRWTRKNK